MEGKIGPVEESKGTYRCSCTTPEGRVCFPSVFTARAMNAESKPRYSCTILLQKDDPAAMDFVRGLGKTITEMARSKWPDTSIDSIEKCLYDGDTSTFTSGPKAGQLRKNSYPEMEGCFVLTCNKREDSGAPAVVDQSVQPILNQGDFYAGCYGRMSFQLYTNSTGKLRVAGGLSNVQKTREGEPLGNAGSRPEDDFGPVSAPASGGEAEPASSSDIFG